MLLQYWAPFVHLYVPPIQVASPLSFLPLSPFCPLDILQQCRCLTWYIFMAWPRHLSSLSLPLCLSLSPSLSLSLFLSEYISLLPFYLLVSAPRPITSRVCVCATSLSLVDGRDGDGRDDVPQFPATQHGPPAAFSKHHSHPILSVCNSAIYRSVVNTQGEPQLIIIYTT